MQLVEGFDHKHYPARMLSPKVLNARREAVRELRQHGWSYRRIATAIGWSHETVRNDARALA